MLFATIYLTLSAENAAITTILHVYTLLLQFLTSSNDKRHWTRTVSACGTGLGQSLHAVLDSDSLCMRVRSSFHSFLPAIPSNFFRCARALRQVYRAQEFYTQTRPVDFSKIMVRL